MTVVNITVTGAAGRIGYSLIPMILNGNIFGPSVRINLRLLDIPDAAEKLQGVAMEIEDSGYALLNNLLVTVNADEAFLDTEVAILVGGFPRLPGMERRDLLLKNAESIKSQALALNQYASRDVKVLVVANPANTNCLVAIKTATNIPPSNFSCLTRLDEERLKSLISKKVSADLGITVSSMSLSNVFIFGNHSTTQVAHITEGVLSGIEGYPNNTIQVKDHFNEEEYQVLLKRVQNRGAEIIKALQMSSAFSAAEAIIKHLKDWVGVGEDGAKFSMGVLINNGTYGLSHELVYSVPCVRSKEASCGYRVLSDLILPENIRILMETSARELLAERSEIESYLTH